MRTSVFARLGCIVATLLVLLAASPAFSEGVHVEVQTIYATTGEAKIDPKLEKLSAELKSGFPGYTVFSLLETKALDIELDKPGELALPEGSVLVLTYHGKTKDNLLRLDVGLKEKIAAEVKASDRSTFFQAGLLYREGILILAIAAERSP